MSEPTTTADTDRAHLEQLASWAEAFGFTVAKGVRFDQRSATTRRFITVSYAEAEGP